MTSVDEILEGLAAALELERELGVRVVEFDRTLLTPPPSSPPSSPPPPRIQASAPPTSRSPAPLASSSSATPTIVFLHDRALSPRGVEMMAKIIAALHQTPETAPILIAGPRPAARVTVVLGLRALRQWFPGVAGAPGQWINPEGLQNVLVTYSPEFILRAGISSETVLKLKREMWTALKSAIRRLATSL